MEAERPSSLGLDVTEFAGAQGSGRPHARHSSQRLANNRLAAFLVFLVAASTIPLGSNRPAFWALSAIAVSAAALIYLLYLNQLRVKPRFGIDRMPVVTVLFGLLAAYLVVQILPIGSFAFRDHNGAVVARMATLSIAPGETVLMLMRQLGYGLFFFLTLQVAVNRDRADSLLLAIFVIATLSAIYAMVALTQLGDPLLFFEKTAYLGAATGTFINRNSFATFLAIGAVTGAALVLARLQDQPAGGRDRRPKWSSGERLYTLCLALAVFLVIATEIATKSRMGTFSMFGGLAVTGVAFAIKSEARFVKALGVLTFVLVAMGAVLAVLFGGGLIERLGSVESSLDVRMSLYRQVVEMIRARPLTGFGGGTFDSAYPLFHRPPVNPDLVWDKAHSTYLTLWSELGLAFGSLPMLILLILAGVLAVRIARTPARVRPTEVAALATLVVGALHSLLDFSLEIQANTYLFLAILGLGIACRREKSRAGERGGASR